MDRITLSDEANIAAYDGADYLENNCAEEPSKLCEFKRVAGRILKTVDSVHQNVQTLDECRDLCLTAPFRCHSYDYNETGELVCRLSHHSRATLTDLSEPTSPSRRPPLTSSPPATMSPSIAAPVR